MHEQITKNYPNNITVTITYNNKPTTEAIRHYARKLKEVVDNVNIIDSRKQVS